MKKFDPKNHLIWLDIETTGLEAESSLLLEVGLRITDLDLNEVDRWNSVIGYTPQFITKVRAEAPEVVRDMHDRSGLWTDCMHARSLDEVEPEACGWLSTTGMVGQTVCGNSLRLDRAFVDFHMPILASLFHYRSIDVSTLKELCRKYNPTVFKHLVETETDHRVNTCIDNSIQEYKFYLDNFLFDGRLTNT